MKQNLQIISILLNAIGTLGLIFCASKYFKSLDDSFKSIERNFNNINNNLQLIEVGTDKWRKTGINHMKLITIFSIIILLTSYLLEFVLIYY